jgi:antitoxin component YwqK of YwqJK toxin-antitoxin module
MTKNWQAQMYKKVREAYGMEHIPMKKFKAQIIHSDSKDYEESQKNGVTLTRFCDLWIWEFYTNGIRNGKYFAWSGSELFIEAEFKNGKPHGKKYEYKSGRIIKCETFDMGIPRGIVWNIRPRKIAPYKKYNLVVR